MRNLILFSGGMDSTIALYWAIHHTSGPIDALVIDYGQRHRAETLCASHIWANAGVECDRLDLYRIVDLIPGTFAGHSSILGNQVPVSQYKDVTEAAQHNQSDGSYIPLRNAVFVSLAANHLLTRSPQGGLIVTGFRGRIGPGGGFQDGSPQFADVLSHALSIGSGKTITVIDPLNRPGRSRRDALELAETLPGCWEALGLSMSCFMGTEPPCGHCLPCLRRAQGFAEYGKEDPLITRLNAGG
jgi:7-cyano-7-deazaguanine synthase